MKGVSCKKLITFVCLLKFGLRRKFGHGVQGRMEWWVARGWLRTVDLGSNTRQINKRVPFGGYRRYVDIFILPIPQALLFWDHTIVV
jgi:hypothetical protein